MVDIDLLGIDSLAAAMEAPQEGEIVVDMSLDIIIPDPDQPRKQRNKVKDDELTASIKSGGVRQPIIVLPMGENGKHTIVYGERRWDCSGRAGRTTIPAIVRNLSPQEVLIAQLSENIDRDDMTLADEVAGVRRAVDELGSAKAAAQALGKPMTWISKRQKIAKSTDFLQEFMEAGYSADAEGFYQLARLAEKHEKAAHRLVMQWHSDPTKRASLRLQVAELSDRLEKSGDDNESEPAGKKVQGATKESSPGGVAMTRENTDPAGSPSRVGPDEAGNSASKKRVADAHKQQQILDTPLLVKSYLRSSDGFLLVTEDGELLVTFADGVLEGMCNEASKSE